VLKPTAKADGLALEAALPLCHSFSGIHEQTQTTAALHAPCRQLCSVPALCWAQKGLHKLLKKKSRAWPVCSRSAAGAEKPSCGTDGESPKKGRDEQAG